MSRRGTFCPFRFLDEVAYSLDHRDAHETDESDDAEDHDDERHRDDRGPVPVDHFGPLQDDQHELQNEQQLGDDGRLHQQRLRSSR